MKSVYKIINVKYSCSCKIRETSKEINYQCSIDGSCKQCRKIDNWYDFIKIRDNDLKCSLCQSNSNWYSLYKRECTECNIALDLTLKNDKIECCFVNDSQNDLCEECDNPTFSEYEITKTDKIQELNKENSNHCFNLHLIYKMENLI